MALIIKKKARQWAVATLYGYIYWTKASDGGKKCNDACAGRISNSDGNISFNNSEKAARSERIQRKKGSNNKRRTSSFSQASCKQTKDER